MLVVCVLQCRVNVALRTHGRSASGPEFNVEVRPVISAPDDLPLWRFRLRSWHLGQVCATAAAQNPPCPKPYPHQSEPSGMPFAFSSRTDTAQPASDHDCVMDHRSFRRRGSQLENVTDVLRHDHSSMNGSLASLCKGVGPVRLLVWFRTVSPSPLVKIFIGTLGPDLWLRLKKGPLHAHKRKVKRRTNYISHVKEIR